MKYLFIILTATFISMMANCRNFIDNEMEENVEYIELADSSCYEFVDTIAITGRSLNDIRFEGWTENDWIDNPYIVSLRQYLDDFASGKIENANMEQYKESLTGKFIIGSTSPALLGGLWIEFIPFELPNRIFVSWVYSDVDTDAEKVIDYNVRMVDVHDETIDMTKDDILKALKDYPELKLW